MSKQIMLPIGIGFTAEKISELPHISYIWKRRVRIIRTILNTDLSAEIIALNEDISV
jgi:hypothetical protein